jgi:hypothetical protein
MYTSLCLFVNKYNAPNALCHVIAFNFFFLACPLTSPLACSGSGHSRLPNGRPCASLGRGFAARYCPSRNCVSNGEAMLWLCKSLILNLYRHVSSPEGRVSACVSTELTFPFRGNGGAKPAWVCVSKQGWQKEGACEARRDATPSRPSGGEWGTPKILSGMPKKKAATLSDGRFLRE